LDSIYEFIFRHAAEGILIVNQHNELLHVNPAAVSMLGVDLEAVIGRPVEESFKSNIKLVRLARMMGPTLLDIRMPGERLATGIAQDIADRRVVILNDVTEQRDMNAHREALVRTVAHDLRNTLNAMAGYADLVQKLGDVNPQQEKWLKRVRQTTNKLYEMAIKLVDLAWIESGMPMEFVPVELVGLTRDVIDELKWEARKRQISIVNSIPDELPAVMGDPGRLRQTITNLLDNALRYSLPETNVVVHAWHQYDEVFYTVADQGIGITPDDQEKIWDRMWRSGDDRVRDTSGGGIGLPFAQTIIKRHGGTIWVESELNQGTTFTFRLPVTRGG
jgi:signal transduction histidine kinase